MSASKSSEISVEPWPSLIFYIFFSAPMDDLFNIEILWIKNLLIDKHRFFDQIYYVRLNLNGFL